MAYHQESIINRFLLSCITELYYTWCVTMWTNRYNRLALYNSMLPLISYNFHDKLFAKLLRPLPCFTSLYYICIYLCRFYEMKLLSIVRKIPSATSCSTAALLGRGKFWFESSIRSYRPPYRMINKSAVTHTILCPYSKASYTFARAYLELWRGGGGHLYQMCWQPIKYF